MTIFAYRVGVSVVSAISQTPASGPSALLTTPPRSLLPTLTAGPRCCALAPTGIAAVAKAVINIEATMCGRPTNVRVFMVFYPRLTSLVRRAACAHYALLSMSPPGWISSRLRLLLVSLCGSRLVAGAILNDVGTAKKQLTHAFCNGPRLVNPFCVVGSPGSRFCTGSAHGRHLMGLEEDRSTNLRSRAHEATWWATA